MLKVKARIHKPFFYWHNAYETNYLQMDKRTGGKHNKQTLLYVPTHYKYFLIMYTISIDVVKSRWR